MLSHLRHASVLATLTLLELLVVESLLLSLLILLTHVASVVSRCARHGWRRLRHAGHIIGRANIITAIDAVLAARFGGVEAGLNEVLAFGLGDEGLEFGSCEGVDETCLGDDQEKDLGSSEDGKLIGL